MNNVPPWEKNWDPYYELAEKSASDTFYYLPKLIDRELWDRFDFETVLDFACGAGRMAEQFSQVSNNIICCDIQKNAIEKCQERFKNYQGNCRFSYIINDLNRINITSDSVSFVYSWDSMVHFNLEAIEIYAKEFYRVLEKGKYGFIHHSNYASLDYYQPNIWNWNPHCRENVSLEEVRDVFLKCGFMVIKQISLDWGEFKNLDGITVFLK